LTKLREAPRKENGDKYVSEEDSGGKDENHTPLKNAEATDCIRRI